MESNSTCEHHADCYIPQVVFEIVKLCPHDDLHSLCLTAKYLYFICKPVLYSNVDLSIHNRGEVKIRPTDGFTQASNSYWCTQVWNLAASLSAFCTLRSAVWAARNTA